MATYRYRAYTAQGVVTAGTIAAEGINAAIDALYASGLTPFETLLSEAGDGARPSVSQQGRPVWRRKFGRSNKFGLSELTAFTVEMAALVNSGLPLDVSFRVLAGPGTSPKRALLARDLLREILGGAQLSEAMRHRPTIFPQDYLAIVAAGEASGQTGEVLGQIGDMLTKRLEIRNKIRSSLIYPVILLFMSLASVAVIVFVLIPNLSPIFADAGLPLPGILGVLASIPDYWLPLTVYLLGGAAVCTMLWYRITKSPSLALKLDRIKSSVPVLGRLLRMREAGLFARSLGTLLDARVPLMSALQTARSLIVNRYMNAGYADAISRVPEGASLNQAFAGTDLLPPAALQLIAVGEQSGQLARMLIRIAATLDGELQRHLEQMVNLLTPVLTLVIGGAVGALIMQVMSAVLSINNLAIQ
ncbi:type II secretion system F family protein [Bradyrhizobium diazoefficiens]|uniref:type II secretion system F family protein n=1 Tax=Bradyrhizobium diazoefficiens TaxID=1355477 RepID=UPI00190E1C14|nr:type II secretion system F family protein [Bradyrhizobium diazoefficiens]MBK3665375.1 type II secretion system F family protein [Bradyrhizobium diazoefficiens]